MTIQLIKSIPMASNTQMPVNPYSAIVGSSNGRHAFPTSVSLFTWAVLFLYSPAQSSLKSLYL